MQRIVLWISLPFALALGCTGPAPRTAGRSVKKVYQQATRRGVPMAGRGLRQEVKITDPFGYPRPYVPVLSHPEVFGVYVVPHTTRGATVSVQGHWVHMKLRESRWWHQDHEEAATLGLERLGLPHRRGPEPKAEMPLPAAKPQMEEIPRGDERR